ncbi:hypothetical protein DFH05DRAFT_1520671 [Lentinula detonsa]|uniref:RPA43 OB domain-containing protein n=1 Tax=Lentinula detonsa TaxID=2804962 RepID=A0A9W8U1G6_9AGAR|nr:hypothetical protein DFH05DRAFT_1520671 [Lentinula detonsa]
MPSALASKKRKQTEQSQESLLASPKKKAKQNAISHFPDNTSYVSSTQHEKNDRNIKGKGKGKGKETAFQVVQSSLVISVSPVFSSNPRAGIEELLDSMIMRYIPALDGVVLSHSNLTFKEDTAAIQADCPFLVCKILFDATVWRPLVGMKLVGKISICSPDHISLLIHKTFNVSIPRHHIPTEEWEFEYGAAENDPEFGAGAEEVGTEMDEGVGEGSGRWVHRVTASSIGGEDGYLELTVIGLLDPVRHFNANTSKTALLSLTVANEMLSLIGSLQRDPFSEAHIPSNSVRNGNGREEVDEEEEERDTVDAFLNGTDVNEGEGDSEEVVESDQDGFEALHKKQNDANVERSRQTAAEKGKQETEKKQKKKKKRKVEEVVGGEIHVEQSQKMMKKRKKTEK